MDQPITVSPRESVQRAARQAYGAPAAAAAPGVDIAALARRMQRSEDEVRLLLRRQEALRS
jgi:hypothetical protein